MRDAHQPARFGFGARSRLDASVLSVRVRLCLTRCRGVRPSRWQRKASVRRAGDADLRQVSAIGRVVVTAAVASLHGAVATISVDADAVAALTSHSALAKGQLFFTTVAARAAVIDIDQEINARAATVIFLDLQTAALGVHAALVGSALYAAVPAIRVVAPSVRACGIVRRNFATGRLVRIFTDAATPTRIFELIGTSSACASVHPQWFEASTAAASQ